jgi:hypothetical protein
LWSFNYGKFLLGVYPYPPHFCRANSLHIVLTLANMTQRIIDRSYVGEVLQHIYNSDLDINVAITLSGGYFYAHVNKRIPLQGTTIEEAVTHLAHLLTKEFPSSTFTSWWVDNFREQELTKAQ